MKCPKCSRDNGSEHPVKSCRCGYSSFVTEKRQAKAQHNERVGSELKKLIPSYFEKIGCGCNQYAARMDNWGIEGCTERHEEIVQHLVSQATGTIVGVLPEAMTRAVAKRLLDKAIQNARDSNE